MNSDKEFDKGIELEEGVKEKGAFDMMSRSPLRSEFGEGSGSKLAMEGSDLNEFHGGLPKSPMRERFLNDPSSSPVRSRNVSPSPMRGKGSSDDLDDDGFDTSRTRSRKVSMSPLRERGSSSPMSVRTRNVSSSPMRGVNGVNKSPAESLNGTSSSQRKDDNCDFDGSSEGIGDSFDGLERGVRRHMMTPKTSFNTWLSDDYDAGGSNDDGLGRRRSNWRDRVGDNADRISAGKEIGRAHV